MGRTRPGVFGVGNGLIRGLRGLQGFCTLNVPPPAASRPGSALSGGHVNTSHTIKHRCLCSRRPPLTVRGFAAPPDVGLSGLALTRPVKRAIQPGRANNPPQISQALSSAAIHSNDITRMSGAGPSDARLARLRRGADALRFSGLIHGSLARSTTSRRCCRLVAPKFKSSPRQRRATRR